MPISNPLTINPDPPNVLLEASDPIAAPENDRTFWLNTVSRKLWVAIATNSPSDWVAIGGSHNWEDIDNKPNTFPVDVANILNKILVADGQVLTTDDHVIFED